MIMFGVNMKKMICFVIMGFGKKTDPSTGNTLDLDKTYKNVIKPAVEKSGYQCIRADEIKDSGLIDKSMYALLMYADLVVADISTYNPNAIYELGVRHAVRPFSTIIINEEKGSIPFDLNSNRIIHYKHLGEDIGYEEVTRCQNALCDLIENVAKYKLVDSPLYDYINDIKPPKLSKDEYKKIIGELAEKEEHLFGIVEKAKHFMEDSDFPSAIKMWKKACVAAPTEHYFIQQYALATYKAKLPSEAAALSDALSIIEPLSIEGESNDPETLGLMGAIYKRMWLVNSDVEFLKRAISFYSKGYSIRNNYYTGENYAHCLDMMSDFETDDDEITFYKISAKKVRKAIIKDLENNLPDDFSCVNDDIKWKFASLSNCYYGVGDSVKGKEFEKRFREQTNVEWELETFEFSKRSVIELTRN